jgi:CRISPR system Cascade subunit CasD
MSPDIAYLAMLFDAPLQSWGFDSRFQRRTTGLHPTKSGVIGLICAAMGLAKGSAEEEATLPELAKLRMTGIAIPRQAGQAASVSGLLPVRRLEDYHTVLETRRASGTMSRDAVITRRHYLLDARFGVILKGDHELLGRVAAALQNPRWGVWFGRKSCIPAASLFVALSQSQDEAWKAVLRACRLDEGLPLEVFTVVTEVEHFDEGTDSLADQPVSFGDGTSSGPDKRQFAIRRIKIQPGVGLSAKE